MGNGIGGPHDLGMTQLPTGNASYGWLIVVGIGVLLFLTLNGAGKTFVQSAQGMFVFPSGLGKGGCIAICIIVVIIIMAIGAQN